MPWTRHGGWTDPWLPLADTTRNVEDQRSDGDSTLSFVRDLIAARRRLPDLRHGAYEELPAPPGAWAWRRGGGVVVALNLGARGVEIESVTGTIVLSSDRNRDREALAGRLSLDPAQGVVVECS
jgi:alpha-glucosidase